VTRAGEAFVTRATLQGAVVVRVEGELDMSTSAGFEEALTASDPPERLVIDLTKCTFLDSSAVRLLVGAVRTAEETNGHVALVVRDGGIRRVLEIAAVDTLLPVHETLDAALA
jgi:anti-anti-sigma factor